MKTKLDLAHEHIGRLIEYDSDSAAEMTLKELVGYGFDYADAMYAEMEKREDKSLPEILKFAKLESEFKIDWSLAPKNAKYWAIDSSGFADWFESKPELDCSCFEGGRIGSAYHFNYTGDWRESLRKRP